MFDRRARLRHSADGSTALARCLDTASGSTSPPRIAPRLIAYLQAL